MLGVIVPMELALLAAMKSGLRDRNNADTGPSSCRCGASAAMKSGLRDRNNDPLFVLENGAFFDAAMKSGLRDRNNRHRIPWGGDRREGSCNEVRS